jgi:hypothetical protein
LLSGCPGVRGVFVTFVDGAIAGAIIEHAPIPSVAGRSDRCVFCT